MQSLDEESSKLCIFNTPFGRYRFLRLPFGINGTPEMLHGKMVKLFNDINGINPNKKIENLKRILTQTSLLTYFKPSKSLTLPVDASKSAVGAAILHDRRPIVYASASLTDTQTRYAQFKKELFAIFFGCTRFNQFVYGMKGVIVETDHKPLVTLFNKPLFKIQARLQRFMLKLQCYDLDVRYKPENYYKCS